MAVQPLSPATDRRLGGPLPRQLANRTRVHLSADCSFGTATMRYTVRYAVLAFVFRTLFPSERQVTHALLTRPPLGFGKQAFLALRSTCMC